MPPQPSDTEHRRIAQPRTFRQSHTPQSWSIHDQMIDRGVPQPTASRQVDLSEMFERIRQWAAKYRFLPSRIDGVPWMPQHAAFRFVLGHDHHSGQIRDPVVGQIGITVEP